MIESGLIETFGLHLARSSALVLASPLLGNGADMPGYKIALILSLSSLTFLATGADLLGELDALTFIVLALRELVIGIALAFFLHLVLSGLRVGTEMVGQEMAFAMAGTVDPMTGNTNAPVTYLYEVLFYLAILAVDGHHWIVRALCASHERAPVGEVLVGTGIVSLIVQFFGQVFAAGITFAAPVLLLLFMVSVLIGVLARAVPHINVLEFGFSLRIAVGVLGLAVFSPTITPAFEALLGRFMAGLEAGLDALGA